MNKSHTGTIAIVIAVVLAIIAYFYVQGGSSSSSSSGLVADSQRDVGLAEVNLLNQIQSIRIDTSLFQNPTYLGLLDHTVAIPTQNVGRANPFAPIPGVGNPAATPTK